MSPIVEVFWSFRSPYSRLVTADLQDLRQDFDIDLRIRPVLPLAIRFPEAVFDANDRRAPLYIVMDSQRRGEMLGRPIVFPTPDPVVQDFSTMTVSEDQPYIYDLTMLGVEASRRGKGVEFIHHVAELIFGGTPNWDQGDLLEDAVAAAHLDLDDLRSAIRDGDHMNEIERNHEGLEASGHWGVPTMVFEGECFFGQDRIETLRWRLGQAGLAK
ncbi:MAG: 2-hydroxychromene-2-carboxylate isomerase [Henriciella sp.]